MLISDACALAPGDVLFTAGAYRIVGAAVTDSDGSTNGWTVDGGPFQFAPGARVHAALAQPEMVTR